MIKIFLTTYNRDRILRDLKLTYHGSTLTSELKKAVVNLSWEFLAKIVRDEFNFELDIENGLEFNENGKPYFKNDHPCYFNISHAGHLIAIAISDNKVGCDIEKVDYFLRKGFKLRNSWSLKEKQLLKKEKEKQVLMAKFMTRKKAYIKLKGYSLVDTKLKDVHIEPNNQRLLVQDQDAYAITVINKGDERTDKLILDKNIKMLKRFDK